MLTIKELEALDAIRAMVGQVGDVHEIHPRAYVVAKDKMHIVVAIPPQDSKTGDRHHRVMKYRDLEVGEWCCIARVSLPGDGNIWVAAPVLVES